MKKAIYIITISFLSMQLCIFYTFEIRHKWHELDPDFQYKNTVQILYFGATIILFNPIIAFLKLEFFITIPLIWFCTVILFFMAFNKFSDLFISVFALAFAFLNYGLCKEYCRLKN